MEFCQVFLFSQQFNISSEKWIQDINQIFYLSWEIGKHWLEYLKNLIFEPFELEIVEILAKNW